MGESRTNKTIRNIVFSIIYKLSDVVLAFVIRTIFIRELGINYLGISGLFSSILSVLSLMELGVGSAIAFSLYQPLAVNDHSKIAALMKLYKHTYAVIGVLVCSVGFTLTPFLGRIINLPENIDNLVLIYWLSVANTATSYFLAYKRTLLTADQKAYVCTKVDIFFRYVRCIGLIAALVFTHSYLIYLTFDVVTTLLCNIVISEKVKKIYPYLATTDAPPLEKNEKKNIVRYMSSTLFTKLGQTVVTSTDSIIISAFINTTMVGYYSNYQMIYANLDMILYLMFSNITASVGNYAVTNSGEQSHALFKKINLANFMTACWISVCIFCLSSPFISLWVGGQYCLSEWTVAAITLNFFITANQNCVSNFMSAMGKLYYRNRFRSLVEAVVNLVSSIILVKYTDWGITGVFLGTTLCFIAGRMWMDARVLHKYWFHTSFAEYLKGYFLRFLLFVGLCVALKQMSGMIFGLWGISIFSWLLVAVLCSICCLLIFVSLWRKTDEFRYIEGLFVTIIKKRRGSNEA